MDFIVAPLVCGIIFYFTYLVFELFVRKKERQTLIEKMVSQNTFQFDPSVLKNPLEPLLGSFPKRSFTGLRIGCLLIGLGLGLLMGLFVGFSIRACYSMNDWDFHAYQSIALGASVLFMGGVGLLVAYLIERKERRKA